MMDKCQRQRITLLSLRSLLSAGVGVVAGFAAFLAANHFGIDLPAGSEALFGCAAGAIAWFASRSKFQFTEECMHMARGADLRQVAPVKLGKERPVRSAAPSAGKKPETRTPAVLNAGQFFKRGRIEVTVQVGENDSKNIEVTTRGLSGSEFKGNNGLRPRLESVSGVSWENPRNDQNGTRTMIGKVTGRNESEIAEKLTAICERFA